ncbi:MAG: hypothetical protein ACRC80_22550 [Waterburya sp.]
MLEINNIDNIQIQDKKEKKIIITLSFLAAVISQSLFIVFYKSNLFYQSLFANVFSVFTFGVMFAGFIGKEIRLFTKPEIAPFKYCIYFIFHLILSFVLSELMFLIYFIKAKYVKLFLLKISFFFLTLPAGLILTGLYNKQRNELKDSLLITPKNHIFMDILIFLLISLYAFNF